MAKSIQASALAAVALTGNALIASQAQATLIEIFCSENEGCGKYTGETTDGTVFLANPNPAEPSIGTGVFEPFKRVQKSTGGDGRLQSGFNTDAGEPDINFNTKNGSQWTRSVLFGELGLVDLEGQLYRELRLDANQLGKGTSKSNRILLTDMQIYIGDDPNLANPESTGTGFDGTGYTGTPFDSSDNSLLDLSPIWTLDGVLNGDVDVLLQASICDAAGQCGSGHGDMSMFIPERVLLGSPTDYFVLYTEYDRANDGFEEWSFASSVNPPPPPVEVPEPAPLTLLGGGLLALCFVRRRVARVDPSHRV